MPSLKKAFYGIPIQITRWHSFNRLSFPRLFACYAKVQVDFSNYVGMSFRNGTAAKWSKPIPHFHVKTFSPNEAITRKSFTAALLVLYGDDLQACGFNDYYPGPTAGRNRGASPAAARESDAPPVVSFLTCPLLLIKQCRLSEPIRMTRWLPIVKAGKDWKREIL